MRLLLVSKSEVFSEVFFKKLLGVQGVQPPHRNSFIPKLLSLTLFL